jgi:outer membrane protease
MKRFFPFFLLSVLFTVWSVGFGLPQTDAADGLSQSEPQVGWQFKTGRFYLDLGVQAGYLKGDSTYRITFPGGASQLEFPLRTYLIGPQLVWGYKNNEKQDVVRLEAKWLTNIGHGSGKMKDSDWFDNDSDFFGEPVPDHPGKDIYSESKIDLGANIFEANVVYNFWPVKFFGIGPLAGYKYQRFKYEVSNTNQVGYGPYAPDSTAYDPGRTLDYKVRYSLPYFGLGSDLMLGDKIRINFKGAYSPWASAKDTDDHLLRFQLSKGDTDGYAYFGNVNGNWNFLPHWILTIGGEYMKIHTTGTQHQSAYDGSGFTADVDDRITSKQWFYSAMVTYRF